MFLALFIALGLVNIDLFLQIRKHEKASTYKFKQERCMLLTVLIAFELGYFVRFLFEIYSLEMTQSGKYAKFFITQDVSYLLEALSLMALLVFHYRNFKTNADHAKHLHQQLSQTQGKVLSEGQNEDLVSNLAMTEDVFSIQNKFDENDSSSSVDESSKFFHSEGIQETQSADFGQLGHEKIGPSDKHLRGRSNSR